MQTTNGMLITSMFVLKHYIMTNSVGSADSKVAAEQVVTNILWEGLVASGQHPDTLLILYSLNISVVKVLATAV